MPRWINRAAVISAIIGGGLGLWTFIDTYLLSFSPRLSLGGKLLAHAKKGGYLKGKQFYLQAVLLPIEIGNHRNRYGFIHDLAIRVYAATELNPGEGIYFASNVWDRLPASESDLSSGSRTVFSPIASLPKSKQSLVVEFGDLTDRSPMVLEEGKELMAEIFYQEGPEEKWTFVQRSMLHFDSASGTGPILIAYRLLDRFVSRGKIKATLPDIEVHLYEGISDRRIDLRFKRVQVLVIRPFWFCIQLARSLLSWSSAAISWIYDVAVREPIMVRNATKLATLRISVGLPELVEKTDASLRAIMSLFNKWIKKINKTADSSAKIAFVPKTSGQFSRNGATLQVYKSGDGSITAQGRDRSGSPRFTLTMHQVKLFRRFSYWRMDNFGPITVKSFATRVMDAFVLHSSY
ncbi:MAG: hypothetical protein ACYCPQ_04555 [Elusimicrobiota bacterium]